MLAIRYLLNAYYVLDLGDSVVGKISTVSVETKTKLNKTKTKTKLKQKQR